MEAEAEAEAEVSLSIHFSCGSQAIYLSRCFWYQKTSYVGGGVGIEVGIEVEAPLLRNMPNFV